MWEPLLSGAARAGAATPAPGDAGLLGAWPGAVSPCVGGRCWGRLRAGQWGENPGQKWGWEMGCSWDGRDWGQSGARQRDRTSRAVPMCCGHSLLGQWLGWWPQTGGCWCVVTLAPAPRGGDSESRAVPGRAGQRCRARGLSAGSRPCGAKGGRCPSPQGLWPYEIWLLSCPGYRSKRRLASSLSASPAGERGRAVSSSAAYHQPQHASDPTPAPASCPSTPSPAALRPGAVTDVAAVHPDAVPVVLAVAFHGVVGEVALCHLEVGVDHDLRASGSEGGSP